MIANTAFLAALTLFLLVAWLAGELSFLTPVQGDPLPPARPVHPRGHAPRVPESLRASITRSRDGSSCVRPVAN